MRSNSNKKEKPSNIGVEPSVVAGEMSFMCEICGKNFSSINGLKSHSKIHTGEKNETSFTCADCGMKFRKQRELSIEFASKNSHWRMFFFLSRLSQTVSAKRLLECTPEKAGLVKSHMLVQIVT